ncbi:MAG: Ig-like domain repeat protein [Acidobacteria bacterium]|nr:Ig-like domain repeat protein [Acidobacteriota bacterium]
MVIAASAGSSLGQPNRIAAKIDNSRRFTLTGQVHPYAVSDYDQGRVDPSQQLNRVTLVLQPSADQQAALDRLLADQQDPRSESYHQWLTPEEYANRFGASQSDIDQISAWLEARQLKVTDLARARNAVSIKGSAGQVESAFAIQIHTYVVNGETHYANSTDPSLPAALQGVVQSIRGLHDFRPKARARKITSLGVGAKPDYTSSTSGNHYLGPDDFATIFDLKPLHNASINGAGQKIVIVGQSRISTSNLATFRSYFGLSTANLTTTLVPNTRDPGSVEADAQESDLDLEWASAVARSASLIFVYSYDVFNAVQYAVDQNLAPVLSMSYGECESAATRSDAVALRTWAQQASAQGITWVAASGDSGAAGCYQSSSGFFGPAASNLSLATDLPASVPEITGVGGTTLAEGSGTYWKSTNDSTTKASALSYIPETAWNDSATGDPAASGGGVSQFFAKPSWQAGTGVPSDGMRDVPDISFPASPQHDGYMVYTTSGRTSGWYVFGGTSAGAPAFAGVLAMLNQYLAANGLQSSAGLGNINSHLYSLASTAPAVFHDIVAGDNIVSASTCTTPRCTGSVLSVGYKTSTGYDQVTGLGSVDGYSFITAWHTGALLAKSTPTVTVTADATSISTTGTASFTVAVTGASSTSPTGTVTLSTGGTALASATLSGTGGGATATLTVSGSNSALASGANTITASYSGDGGYEPANSTVVLTVANSSTASPAIAGVANAASYQQAYAPGMILAIFGSELASSTQTAAAAPLPTTLGGAWVTINGVAAPFYYASPGQLNVQIPYETPISGSVDLVVSNGGQTASMKIAMSAAAPGIFVDSSGVVVPASSASRGDTIVLYITGAGAVTPSPGTGATPASGVTPAPSRAVTVTIGGVSATTTYVGVPSWAVGVVQINVQVPSSTVVGTRAVTVAVGGTTSSAATLTVR